MKNNFNELFEEIIQDLKASDLVDVNEILDEMMPRIRFEGRVTKSMMARKIVRGQLTSALNMHEIYSCEKGNNGHFVYLGNANEEQLLYLKEKAQRDVDAAEKRKAKSEELLYQISAAWDENGKFIGFIIPEAKIEV